MIKATSFLPRRHSLGIIGIFTALFIFFGLGLWTGRFFPLEHPWTLNDLHRLDASPAPDPAADLMALYARQSGFGCEIRLDYLDLPASPRYDLNLTIGQRSLHLKETQSLPPGLRLAYDAQTDILTIALQDCALQANTLLKAATPTETLTAVFGAQPIVIPAALQFVFYNTFSPAATPAQALRRWDGAHTGPRGERHGLRGLLSAAEKYHIPLTLPGLKTPAALSALDAVGGLAQTRRMETNGLLTLPLVKMEGMEADSLAMSLAAAREFGLTPSLSAADFRPSASIQFQWQSPPLNRDGLPLEFRREIAQNAVDGGTFRLIGGDFQHSTWGTAEYAKPALAWLAARPYVQFVNVYPVEAVNGVPATAPANPVRVSAVQTRLMLASADARLAKNYAAIASGLEEAAAWADNPVPRAECDPDECILASQTFFALFNPRGGRLVFFFYGKEQVVGPMAQFFVGLSDPSAWDLSKAEGADPAQVMGAFADADDAFRQYQAEVRDTASIRFFTADGRQKVFRLTSDGLVVNLFAPQVQTQLPLVLAPEQRFAPGWAARYSLWQTLGETRLGVENVLKVSIRLAGGKVLAADSFLAAIPFLALPENPNAENPPGFYLPFPVTLLSLSGGPQVDVALNVTR